MIYQELFCGRADGKKFVPVLRKIQEKVKKGDVLFPLSVVHLFETAKNENSERRKRLAEFMVSISGAYGIVPYLFVREYEIHNAILKRLGKAPVHDIKKLSIGKGILYSLGVLPKDVGINPEIEKILFQINQFEPFIASFMIDMIDRKLVDEQNKEDLEGFAEFEKERQFKNQTLSKEARLRLAIAEMAKDILIPDIIDKLKALGINVRSFVDGITGAEEWKKFFLSIPTLDIWINLHVLRDNDKSRPVDKNDIKDIGFLSTAIPYCDIVVTEKYWANLLKSNGYESKYNTIILSDLTELLKII